MQGIIKKQFCSSAYLILVQEYCDAMVSWHKWACSWTWCNNQAQLQLGYVNSFKHAMSPTFTFSSTESWKRITSACSSTAAKHSTSLRGVCCYPKSKGRNIQQGLIALNSRENAKKAEKCALKYCWKNTLPAHIEDNARKKILSLRHPVFPRGLPSKH